MWLAAAIVISAVLALAPGSASALDCAAAAWPPYGSLDVAALIRGAQREAVDGDPAAEWLLAALYLRGLGVPQDRGLASKWLEATAHAAASATRMAGGAKALSEAELYAMMNDTAERAFPPMVEREGQAAGIAAFYAQARTVLQVLSGCLDRPHR